MDAEYTHYADHPLYHQALESFQRGNYREGQTNLDELLKLFPLVPELRNLNQDMELRARIDIDEIEDIENWRKARLTNLSIRLGTFLVILLLVIFSVRTYSGWIRGQMVNAQRSIEVQAEQLELGVKFNNARSLLAANRPEDAKALIDQIAAVNPDYPNLAELETQVNALLNIDHDYNQAQKMIEQGLEAEALSALRAIEGVYPGYKDVPQLIEDLERNSFLTELFTDGNFAYQRKDWEAAIAAYGQIRSIDPNYNAADVEQRLFESYINAGEALLTNENSTIEDFDRANNYFRSALALRPQDFQALEKQSEAQKKFADLQIAEYIETASALLRENGDSLVILANAENLFQEALRLRPTDEGLRQQVELARLYLNAIQEFEKSNWNLVIGTLETVVQQEPDYADGTARQALYEAYIGRGDQWLAVGDFVSALTDYQNAAVIAQSQTESIIMLLEAQIKIANVRGLLGEYEEAVRLYQAVVNQLELDLSDRLNNPTLSQQLSYADSLASGRNFRAAYQRYSAIMENPADLFELVEYEVQEGDYIASIANRFNTTIEAIANANRIDNPNKLLSGQRLVIPSVNQTPPTSEATPTPQP
jgi:tetratricopeptide (TPR) repeat protein